MAPRSLRKRLSAFTTTVVAVGLGGGLGALVGKRMVSEIRDLDHESVTKLAKKYLPMLMAFAGREMNKDAMDAYSCGDCKKEFVPMFMLRDELWWQMLTEEERPKQFDMETQKPLCVGHDDKHSRVALCLLCCSARIGRPLRPLDFDDDYWTSAMLRHAAEVVVPAPPDPSVVAN